MRCPKCDSDKLTVIDSRGRNYNKENEQSYSYTRRRRCCLACKERFTTYETLKLTEEKINVIAIKALISSVLILLEKEA